MVEINSGFRITWMLTLMVLVFATTVAAAIERSDGQHSRQRVVISSDNSAGIWEQNEYPAGAPFDDFLAIMQALNEPSLKVAALLPMFGNHNATTATRVTSFLLKHRADGVLVPGLIAKGADSPISATLTDLKFFRVAPGDGVEGRFGPIPPRTCTNAAVQRMFHEAQRGPIIILAIGPLTDVACLVKNYPQILANIHQVVFLAGRYAEDPVLTFTNTLDGETYQQPLPDLNYNKDPAAVQVVLASAVPLTLIPGTLAQHLSVDVDRVAEHGTFLSRWLAGAAVLRNAGARDDVPWDSAVINYLVSPDEYVCGRGNWWIVQCAKEGEEDLCAGHDQDDRLDFLKDETSQLWIDPAVDEEPGTTICYAFNTGAAKRIQQRIEQFAF